MTKLSSVDLSRIMGGQAADLGRYDLKTYKFLTGGTNQGDLVNCEPMAGTPGAWKCGVFAPDAKQGDAPKLEFPLYPVSGVRAPDAQ